MWKKIAASMKNILVDFSSKTTCHGLSQILEPGRKLVSRVIWTLLVIGLVSGVSWQLSLAVIEYAKFGTTTDLTEEYRSELAFPAVTICNINRFFDVKNEEELGTIDALIRASSPYRNKVYDDWWATKVKNYVSELKSHGTKRFLLSDETFSKGWLLNDTTLRHCTFQQKPCSIRNFTRILTPMGLCYTFTSSEEIVQSVPGGGHGLSVYLDIAQTKYTEHPEYGHPDAGVKVHIHNHNEPPEVENFGLTIPSAHAGHMVVKKMERNLMYKPWGICDPNDKKLKYHDHYSTSACMRECRSTHMIKECGCRPYWALEIYDAEECDALQILECAGRAEATFSSSYTLQTCGCNEPCKFTVYDTKMSYSTFPSLEVGVAFSTHPNYDETQAVITSDEIDIDSIKLRKYREDHLMVDVFYDSLSYQRTTQSKRVSEISLMSDIGGLLGLWLGISFVTLSEFVQLVVQMVGEWWKIKTIVVPVLTRWRSKSLRTSKPQGRNTMFGGIPQGFARSGAIRRPVLVQPRREDPVFVIPID